MIARLDDDQNTLGRRQAAQRENPQRWWAVNDHRRPAGEVSVIQTILEQVFPAGLRQELGLAAGEIDAAGRE